MIPKPALPCHTRVMRRDDICLYLGPVERLELQALITNRNTPRKRGLAGRDRVGYG